MEKRSLAWTQSALFICEKCGKYMDIPEGSEPQVAESLKNYYRAELKKDGQHKDIRVMVSGCLDICDRGKQAAAFFKKDNSVSEAWVFDPVTEKDEVFSLLKKASQIK